MNMIGRMIGGAIAGAVKKAVSNNKKKSSSSSSSSRGGSGRSSGGSSSSGSSAVNYGGGYNSNTNWQNERTYLNNLASNGTYGQKEWAKAQQSALDAAYQKHISSQNQAPVRTPGAAPSVPEFNQQSSMYDETYFNRMDNAYSDMLRKQEEARRLAVEQGVNRLEANRSTLNQGYDNAARQAYIAKMQSQKALPQALAAQGISGGGTESAQIAMDTSYGENVNQNEIARQNAMSGLNNAIADVRTTGDLNSVEAALNLQQQQLAAHENAYANKIAQDNWMKQFRQSQEAQGRADYGGLIGAYSNDYAAEINRLLASGVPQDDYRIQMLKAARNQKIADQKSSYSPQSAGGISTYTAQQLYQSGLISYDEYRSIVAANGGLF